MRSGSEIPRATTSVSSRAFSRATLAGALAAGIFLAACAAPSSPQASGGGSPGHARARPEIPVDWPPGKRVVMHVTPSLFQSYVVACDLPVPAWNYLHRGHEVTVAVDADAVTAFRRDGSGKTPLDRLSILPEDVDDLAAFLDVALPRVPKNYGDLYRFLAQGGVRIVANGDALAARRIKPAELDPIVTVVSGAELRRMMSDLDALVPYDDIAVPHHSLFHPDRSH